MQDTLILFPHLITYYVIKWGKLITLIALNEPLTLSRSCGVKGGGEGGIKSFFDLEICRETTWCGKMTLQPSRSPVKSRVFQGYTGVTGIIGDGPQWQLCLNTNWFLRCCLLLGTIGPPCSLICWVATPWRHCFHVTHLKSQKPIPRKNEWSLRTV